MDTHRSATSGKVPRPWALLACAGALCLPGCGGHADFAASTSASTVAPTVTARGSSARTVPPADTVALTPTSALGLLAGIPVQKEHHAGYRRDLFGYPADTDGDGCDTRAEVLIRDSRTPAQVDPVGCGVVAGDWYSPYDGVTWTDPGEVEIDHVVALKEAWDSGAWSWDEARRHAYANDIVDPRTLRVVTTSVNLDKGDKDPSNWIPPDGADVCSYLADWVAIKARWGLSMDSSEWGRIRNLLTAGCPDQVLPTGTQPFVVSVPVSVTPSPGGCDPAYPTVCIPSPPPDLDCGDIPYRRFPVVAPDPHHFDSDHDGVGCES